MHSSISSPENLPRKNIKLEHRYMIIECEVNGGFESYCFEWRVNGVDLMESGPEYTPGNYTPIEHEKHQ